ncbi:MULTISPECIES: hypothetical protein [unclassified Rummeliibacillus]|uniref:hypothetical protein n=1 Tax=unclassified Rummeliibacillus TaxID=2622809 RepID=UPI001313E2DE|nr:MULTISPECIES: hypothetical protein [unclassified Rummeliibacillus]
MISITSNCTEQELIQLAIDEQVKVYPMSILYVEKDDSNPKVLLGYANLTE